MKRKILVWLLPLVVVWFQRLIGLTSRFRFLTNERYEELFKNKKPFIYSIWHTNVLYSPYLHRGKNVAVLISESKDGDYINEVVHRFGNTSIRGSSSKGGSKALKAMIQHLKKGLPAAFTPDGPRGPAFVLQPGIIAAAQVTQVPIIPFHYECSRQWVLEKAWDKHRVPKPFTTFVVSYGEPISVPRNLNEEEFEQMRLKVEEAMLNNRNRAIAEAERIHKGESK
ncbi:lysophospholipid acyltransferase family protein [Leptospira sp. 2 VSF19]|uniref:Lysophospholipid acyltransferase family protein n=1 Tax=Leptospira soteropolitanensis TaxID=2950025 RepID=A0AAW5V8V7_9LEPT|nr:lysophospholipid acyltransferase family protein [Leptospira soteropolitanensis]MCW7491289.1 lysophospholipid acyltransferase family protein [Leptospira soteropolitanensis]MCW7498874.1 lysophospholipid acyltransferase family protein [Leptospira soteropolitanensis]MCW7521534.1 lysophospholipid acyltransferase family protein [Leptospira soteropolitanensis]MCW7524977.1 lysophospholipid acyltransferase family protein [Leptospira soteropolitanensis]MCW7528845.1 lysophospholipid acyltransferase fa